MPKNFTCNQAAEWVTKRHNLGASTLQLSSFNREVRHIGESHKCLRHLFYFKKLLQFGKDSVQRSLDSRRYFPGLCHIFYSLNQNRKYFEIFEALLPKICKCTSVVLNFHIPCRWFGLQRIWQLQVAAPTATPSRLQSSAVICNSLAASPAIYAFKWQPNSKRWWWQ